MTTPPQVPPEPPPPLRLPPAVIAACLTMAFLGLLGAYLWETLHHIDTTALLPVILAFIGAGPGLAALGKIGEVKGGVTTVQHLTNGNMGRLLDLADKMLVAQVSANAAVHSTMQQAVTAATTTEPAHVSIDPAPGASPSVSEAAGPSQ